MLSGSFKFFDERNVKLQSLRIFANLNGKDILWAIFGKLIDYESCFLTGIHNLD